MFSKYNPLFLKLKSQWIEMLKAHLVWGVLFLSLGILVGFVYPNGFWPMGIGIMFFLCYLKVKQSLYSSFLFLFLMSVSFGVGVSSLCLFMKKHPCLEHPIFQTEIYGTVIQNTILPEKQILIVEDVQGSAFASQLPSKVQLTFFDSKRYLPLYSKIHAQVSLFPIKSLFSMNIPDSAYFKKIGARGKILTLLGYSGPKNKRDFFDTLRFKISSHLLNILPESQARIAIPLITGEQKFITPSLYQLYRQSGLTHVLSVSGFHMALLAGFLFFIIRTFCACFPWIALYVSSKKIAAIFSWVGTLFYLILSGNQVPALRSFGMISLVFLGILCDRLSLSMRSLFIVALALLLCCPENVLSVSFQLSFLSVLVLISCHDWVEEKYQHLGSFSRTCLIFLMLNVFISLSLSPLIIQYFNLINPYGLLGNLLFSFLFSFGIMPALFMGCLLMPLDLGDGFFLLAGQMLSWIEKMCQKISTLPFSEITIASYSPLVFIFILYALIFLCLFKLWGKIIASMLLLMAIGVGVFSEKTHLLIQDNSVAWIQEGQFYQSDEGNEDLYQRWRVKRGFKHFQSEKHPKMLTLNGIKIALSSEACAGAHVAVLRYPDARCSLPVFLLKSGEFYQIFVSLKKIKIQSDSRETKIIKP